MAAAVSMLVVYAVQMMAWDGWWESNAEHIADMRDTSRVCCAAESPSGPISTPSVVCGSVTSLHGQTLILPES